MNRNSKTGFWCAKEMTIYCKQMTLIVYILAAYCSFSRPLGVRHLEQDKWENTKGHRNMVKMVSFMGRRKIYNYK